MSASASTYSPIAAPPRAARESFRPNGSASAHLPWLAAVLCAPFCFGAVRPEIQAVLAMPIVASLLWNVHRLRTIPTTRTGKAGLALLIVVIAGSLLPLSTGAVWVLSPEAAALAKKFAFQSSLSLSPADTVLRFWQLALCAAVYLLARQGAAVPQFSGGLTYGLCLALLGLAGAEFWFLADGKGIWNEVRHYPGATFANRNHFASWMVIGSMLVFGALVRKLRHLRENAERKQIAVLVFLSISFLVALSSIVACGSRGGILALVSGLGFWVAVLFRQRSRGVAVAVLGLALLGGGAAFAVWGGTVAERFAQDAFSFKTRLWRDTLLLITQFPVVGIGLGAFEPVFTIFKSFHGEGTFLFAENEYLQWVLETGFVGAFGLVLLLAGPLRLFFVTPPKTRFAKVDLYHGALAALLAFAVHACFEFVGHVMSVALLACTLLGLAAGLKERAAGPALVKLPGRRDLLGATVLILFLAGLAVPQMRAAAGWHHPDPKLRPINPEEMREQAYRAWPLQTERAIFLARRYVALGSDGQMDPARANELADATLRTAIRWRPLDWRLRLERSWLQIAANPAQALPLVLQVMDANPLQAEIPLRYAASFARLHSPTALEILKHARFTRPDDVRRALTIAWEIEPSPDLLREIAPANHAGFRGLERFALEKNLPHLAAEASRMSGR